MRRSSYIDWENTRPWIDRSDADIGAFVSRFSATCNFDLGAKLCQWQENGIVVFEGGVSHAIIDQYLNDLDHLRAHHTEYELTVESAGVSKPIQQFTRSELESDRIKFNLVHSISRAACRLSLTREVCQFLRCIFDSPPCVLQSLTFFKGSQQPIHVDYPYVREQKKLAHLAASWVALEDIDPASGPLAYYPGSHREGVIGYFDWGDGSILMEPDSTRTPMDLAHYLRERVEQAKIEPVVFCPRKGDVLIWHGALAHGGTPIQVPSLTRKSYVTHYTSLEGYPPAHMKPNARSTGAYFSENGGFAFDLPWLNSPARLPSWTSETIPPSAVR